MAGMALPLMLRLLILSTLAFDWCGAAARVVRAVEDGEYPRSTSSFLDADLAKLMKRCSCGAR